MLIDLMDATVDVEEHFMPTIAVLEGQFRIGHELCNELMGALEKAQRQKIFMTEPLTFLDRALVEVHEEGISADSSESLNLV